MRTEKQNLGDWGEKRVAKFCTCPKCKRAHTLKQLPINFKCADIICDFCGFLAQVKTTKVVSIDQPPKKVLGAAWGPQYERMKSAIYFPLFLVLKDKNGLGYAIYYLPTDFQTPSFFICRKPLSDQAKRKGWQGFIYDFDKVPNGALIRLF